MPMYAIATLPLIHRPNDPDSSTSQLWYADDATATGSLSHLRSWWDKLVSIGPSYGYHANPSKTWLVTKEVHLSNAVNTFQDSHVNITAEGRLHLGAALGTQSYVSQFVNMKVQQWCNELKTLSSIASTQPHAAFAAFTHGVSSKWTHLIRTIPSISHLLQPLEDILRHQLIPNLTGRPPPNNSEHDLLALPARLGGIGLTNPLDLSHVEYTASQKIAQPLTNHILQQLTTYPVHIKEKQLASKAANYRLKRHQLQQTASDLLSTLLPPHLQQAMTLAQEKGASSWLTTLPINEFGFALHKRGLLGCSCTPIWLAASSCSHNLCLW